MDKLLLGAARQIITPEIGCALYGYFPDVFSESVADDLTATAFYFKQGTTQALMVSITICTIQTELAQTIAEAIEEKFSIPKEACMLCATHTHTGPNAAGAFGWGDIDREYCSVIFVPGILKAVEGAIATVQPVKMSISCGKSQVGVNRRELNENNQIVLGQTPWGCYDPQMTVISFVNEGAEPVANMVHYGAHATAGGVHHAISRDWPGVMVDILEKESGAITAFFNGPEGDVGPRLTNGYTTGRGDISYAYQIGAVAGQDAVSIYGKIHDYTNVCLSVSCKQLHIPVKNRMDYAAAQEMLDMYKVENSNVRGAIRKHLEDVIASYENGEADAESFVFGQTMIELGNVVFVTFPYELFSEIGLRIKNAIKGKTVLSLSNANGSEGYFPTESEIVRGGYEVNMFLYGHLQPYCDNADYVLMKETVTHIRNMQKESEE